MSEEVKSQSGFTELFPQGKYLSLVLKATDSCEVVKLLNTGHIQLPGVQVMGVHLKDEYDDTKKFKSELSLLLEKYKHIFG